MNPETQSTGLAILREISPWRRFFRSWSLYLLLFATILCVAAAPDQWHWYLLIFLVGSNLLGLSIIFEEGVAQWQTKAFEN